MLAGCSWERRWMQGTKQSSLNSDHPPTPEHPPPPPSLLNHFSVLFPKQVGFFLSIFPVSSKDSDKKARVLNQQWKSTSAFLCPPTIDHLGPWRKELVCLIFGKQWSSGGVKWSSHMGYFLRAGLWRTDFVRDQIFSPVGVLRPGGFCNSSGPCKIYLATVCGLCAKAGNILCLPTQEVCNTRRGRNAIPQEALEEEVAEPLQRTSPSAMPPLGFLKFVWEEVPRELLLLESPRPSPPTLINKNPCCMFADWAGPTSLVTTLSLDALPFTCYLKSDALPFTCY